MLGPALTDLLHTLAETSERAPEQQALFEELMLLRPAFGEPGNTYQATALLAQPKLRLTIEEMGTLSVTRPKTGSGPRKCRCCRQPLPPPAVSGA